MASTVDEFSTTTTTAIMTSTPPITHSKNIHAISAVDSGPASSYFGVYQQTKFASGDVSIRTLAPAAINADPYHKALTTKLFFR